MRLLPTTMQAEYKQTSLNEHTNRTRRQAERGNKSHNQKSLTITQVKQSGQIDKPDKRTNRQAERGNKPNNHTSQTITQTGHKGT